MKGRKRWLVKSDCSTGRWRVTAFALIMKRYCYGKSRNYETNWIQDFIVQDVLALNPDPHARPRFCQLFPAARQPGVVADVKIVPPLRNWAFHSLTVRCSNARRFTPFPRRWRWRKVVLCTSAFHAWIPCIVFEWPLVRPGWWLARFIGDSLGCFLSHLWGPVDDSCRLATGSGRILLVSLWRSVITRTLSGHDRGHPDAAQGEPDRRKVPGQVVKSACTTRASAERSLGRANHGFAVRPKAIYAGKEKGESFTIAWRRFRQTIRHAPLLPQAFLWWGGCSYLEQPPRRLVRWLLSSQGMGLEWGFCNYPAAAAPWISHCWPHFGWPQFLRNPCPCCQAHKSDCTPLRLPTRQWEEKSRRPLRRRESND